MQGMDLAGAAQHLCATLVAVTSLLWAGLCPQLMGDKPPALSHLIYLQGLFAQCHHCRGLLSFQLSSVDLFSAGLCAAAGIDVQWPNQRF